MHTVAAKKKLATDLAYIELVISDGAPRAFLAVWHDGNLGRHRRRVGHVFDLHGHRLGTRRPRRVARRVGGVVRARRDG